MAYFLKRGRTTTYNRTINISAGTTAERPSSGVNGDIRFNTDTSRVEYFDGSAFRSVTPQGTKNIIKDGNVTGDGTATNFTNFFATAPVDENNVIVIVGNVVQEPDQAYTISGRDITFTSPPPNTHRVYALVGFDSTVTDNLA